MSGKKDPTVARVLAEAFGGPMSDEAAAQLDERVRNLKVAERVREERYARRELVKHAIAGMLANEIAFEGDEPYQVKILVRRAFEIADEVIEEERRRDPHPLVKSTVT